TTRTTFYVDPVIGNDASTGTMASPFKTLTRALCITGPGKTIFAQSGTYSATTNGEQFPLVVQGQKVQSSSVSGAVVTGVGPVAGQTLGATFDLRPVASSQSKVFGFAVTGTMATNGI